jgi:hypothetical protein
MWEPFLWLALIVAAWRWVTRRRSDSNAFGPVASVGDAPPDAEPLIRPRLDDNGLGTYSMVVPGRRPTVGRRPRPAPRAIQR